MCTFMDYNFLFFLIRLEFHNGESYVLWHICAATFQWFTAYGYLNNDVILSFLFSYDVERFHKHNLSHLWCPYKKIKWEYWGIQLFLGKYPIWWHSLKMCVRHNFKVDRVFSSTVHAWYVLHNVLTRALNKSLDYSSYFYRQLLRRFLFCFVLFSLWSGWILFLFLIQMKRWNMERTKLHWNEIWLKNPL